MLAEKPAEDALALNAPPAETEDRHTSALARLPTGAKLFLILSAALLPLALIAMAASLQTTRTADLDTRTRLRVAATESARTLGIELQGDMGALRASLAAIELDPADTASCARATGVFAQGVAGGARFTIYDRAGALRCGVASPKGEDAAITDAVVARIVTGRGVALAIGGEAGRARATAFFPIAFLREASAPSGFVPDYGAQLVRGDAELRLRTLNANAPLPRHERLTVPVGVDELTLDMTVASAPITSALMVATLLPLLMWAAAAGIGWFVVDRLLIRPLRKLRGRVGAYVPGDRLDPEPYRAMPAHEIRELGLTFRTLGDTIRDHQSDLAEGLVRQTKLTREVHHRVKNNLQVISSLINFHSRSAPTPEASAAYASIQRRVDALAVVHRNHFAEMEVNRGLSLRSVLSELAANIRATVPERSAHLGITLELGPYLVSQDTAVAVAFLVTELVELSMTASPTAQLRLSNAPADVPDRAIVRISSPALIDSDAMKTLLATRYGRVIEGLSRQLRSKLHHDPLTGAFEIAVAITGTD